MLVALLNAQNPALSVPKFKGIEITGTVDQFGSKLTNQGFKFLGNEDYGSVYMGSFAGINDCLVILVPVVNSKDIASVNVIIGLTLSDYNDGGISHQGRQKHGLRSGGYHITLLEC